MHLTRHWHKGARMPYRCTPPQQTYTQIYTSVHASHKHYVDRIRNFVNVTCTVLRKTTSSNNRPVPSSTNRVEKKIVRSYVIRELFILTEKKETTWADSTLLLSGIQRIGLLLSSEEISTPLQFVADGSYEKNACSDTGWKTNDTLRMPTLASCFWYLVSKRAC